MSVSRRKKKRGGKRTLTLENDGVWVIFLSSNPNPYLLSESINEVIFIPRRMLSSYLNSKPGVTLR